MDLAAASRSMRLTSGGVEPNFAVPLSRTGSTLSRPHLFTRETSVGLIMLVAFFCLGGMGIERAVYDDDPYTHFIHCGHINHRAAPSALTFR